MVLGQRFLSVGASGLLCLALAGCLTPAAGPPAPGVVGLATSIDPAINDLAPAIPYALVKLDNRSAAVLAKLEPATLAGAFKDRRPPTPIVYGIGDVVSVTIFEAAAGGLFIPIEAGVRPGNFVTIPDQVVDNEGNISVPYAGLIKAGGRTNYQIQNDIVQRIRNRAIEPQVVVSQSQQRSSLVSVFGEVGTPTRFPIPGLGASDRLTDAITRAGGIKGQGYETWVMLERNGRRGTVPFANLVYQPENNIYLQPGDRIYVYREQHSAARASRNTPACRHHWRTWAFPGHGDHRTRRSRRFSFFQFSAGPLRAFPTIHVALLAVFSIGHQLLQARTRLLRDFPICRNEKHQEATCRRCRTARM